MKTIITILAIAATLVSCQEKTRTVTVVNTTTLDTLKVDEVDLYEEAKVGHSLVLAHGLKGESLKVISVK